MVKEQYMKRREFLKHSGSLIAVGALPGVSFASKAPESPKRLNLLFITVDDMNGSLPGFMGGKYNLTPNLDALAARSHRFVNNRTTAPICQPSREAMMTGRVPHRSGALGFTPVNEGVPTLTTILQAQNYYTAAVHKTEHMQPPSCFPWDKSVVGRDRNPPEYTHAVTEEILKARKANRPFFINCNLNDPHRPFYGSPQAEEMDHHQSGSYKIPRELSANDVEVPSFLEDLPDVRKEFAQYCNSVQRMDSTIGKVLDVLDATHESENTVVLFSSDHGMPFPFAKATVYDNGTRTPVLLSCPKTGSPRTFKQMTCNIDILPTILDLLGVPVPEGVDGYSWMPLIQGRQYKEREFVITHVNSVISGANFPMRAIQDSRYSLVFTSWSDGHTKLKVESMSGLTYPAMVHAAKSDARIAARVKQYVVGTTWGFYDLVADPGQRTNLFDAPEYRERIKKMQQQLLAYMTETSDPQLDNLKAVLAGGKAIVQQPAVLRTGPQ